MLKDPIIPVMVPRSPNNGARVTIVSRIASRQYGDAQKWRRIYEANRDLIKDPDLIYPGQQLRIPE